MDYKKYSLEKLQEWVHDALSTSEASPHEIYSAIREAVRDDYYCYKHHASRAYGLLALLNGERPVKDEEFLSTPVKYDDHMKSYVPSTCDKDDKSPECQQAWNDFWEENYYPEEHKKPKVEDVMPPWGHSDMEALRYTEEELSAMCDAAEKKDKVVKWQLPVEVDGLTGDCFVQFPDDLLEAADLKEGDGVEWVDKGDGSYLLRKINES